jgi:hypothetical protein
MRLTFKPFDGRSTKPIDVIDLESNRIVGSIKSRWSDYPGIEISLFDRKYEASVSSYDECPGLVRGVEAVLNRMTSIDDGRTKLENLLFNMKYDSQK